MYGMGVVDAPLDDDVAVLRRQLWLVTDAAYRRALSSFAKKQAAQQNQAAPDPIPDWSQETPRTTRLHGAAGGGGDRAVARARAHAVEGPRVRPS